MEKPKVKLTGTDGNVFGLLGRCTSALKKAGKIDECQKLRESVFAAKSYDEALRIMAQYCSIT